MEILLRTIEITKPIDESFTIDKIVSCSIADNQGLTVRFSNKDDPKKDLLINFTKEETEKIKRALHN